jgi:tRNA pseudouridine65 synthase
LTLDLLFSDPHLVAVHKPSGMVTHPRADCVDGLSCVETLKELLGRPVYPVHRLDRATSGVLLMALDPETARSLCALFASQQVIKTYLAVVRGILPSQGTIDRALASREKKDGTPKPSVTDYRCLASIEMPWPVRPYPTARYSLACLRPRTGRRHQLRRHLAGISHPILGDTVYGDGAHNRALRDHLACHRLLLHAASLDLPHPTYPKSRLVIRAPLGSDWLEPTHRLFGDGIIDFGAHAAEGFSD